MGVTITGEESKVTVFLVRRTGRPKLGNWRGARGGVGVITGGYSLNRSEVNHMRPANSRIIDVKVNPVGNGCPRVIPRPSI